MAESQDARYDRYADIFENETSAQSIELGNRALHWLFMENFQSSTGFLVVTQHARKAMEGEAAMKLSDPQHRALAVLLGGQVLTARQVGEVTGQSSDGAACTLRSLVGRGLVILGHHDGDRYGYKITDEGREHFGSAPADSRAYVLAKFLPLYGTGHGRPTHIVLNSPGRYGGFNYPALCGVSPNARQQGKVATATCRRCLRRALRWHIIPPPGGLGDPVHGGDVFSRIEASTR